MIQWKHNMEENSIKEPKTNKENTPVVKAEYKDIEAPQSESVGIDDIDGLIETVTANPTKKARKFFEQFKINGTDGTVCVYDSVNGVWLCVGANTVFTGLVTSGGSASTPFPTGWSVQKTATGAYAVTHNLGHQNYSIIIFAYGTQLRAVSITNKSDDTFAILIKDSGGTDTDNIFYFMVKDES